MPDAVKIKGVDDFQKEYQIGTMDETNIPLSNTPASTDTTCQKRKITSLTKNNFKDNNNVWSDKPIDNTTSGIIVWLDQSFFIMHTHIVTSFMPTLFF